MGEHLLKDMALVGILLMLSGFADDKVSYFGFYLMIISKPSKAFYDISSSKRSGLSVQQPSRTFQKCWRTQELS